MRRSVYLAVVFSFLALGARADQLTLKNGDRLTGTIIASDAKTLLIKTDLAGDITVQWDGIASITSSQPLHLQLKDGQTVVGTVTTSDSKFDVATPTTGEVAAPRDAVVAVRNDTEEKAYESQVYRLEHPRLTDFWAGTFDNSLSMTSGNSSTLAYSMAFKAARTTSRDKISVYSTAVYASDNNVVPGVTTADDIRGGVRFDLNLSDRTFAYGFTDFEYDQFLHLDLRNVIGGGLGYHVVKTKNTQFDVFGGGDLDQEFYSPYPPLLLTSLSRRFGEINIGESLNTKLGDRLTLTETFSAFPNVSAFGDYRYELDATAATMLKKWLSWQVTYSDRYLSNPPPGLKTEDKLLSTGLRLSFGKNTL